MKKEDLIRFIKGTGDCKFQQSVIDWVKSSAENRSHYNKVKAEYVSKFGTGDHLDIDIEKEFDRFQIKKQRSYSRTLFTRIAAVITIALLTAGGWFLMQSNLSSEPLAIYKAEPSSMEEIILPDGSKVFLNSESVIKISNAFNQSNREVTLEGEAFFEVQKNKSKPFLVNTESNLQIRVLGTSFNVKSYKTDQIIETTLVSGKVELLQKNKSQAVIALSPNQKASYNKLEDKLNVDIVSTGEITSWRSGVLIFDNEPVQNVINNLERWYDVKIQIEDREIKTYTFSGKVNREKNIEEVLQLIEASSPVKYEYDENKKTFILRGDK